MGPLLHEEGPTPACKQAMVGPLGSAKTIPWN